ncbi:hypothetical protein Q5Y75_27540 [Ruegeria sp. 2205SS24-7]|uniref:hypothetical protein n=1 Tax=Ruegeria discodermiae TaxID=3064389 RepID=UPI002740904E|nr:hypothetical protein [Ruegeria sp. 2205SS24-7]MDP5220944.1 hypothetical protein [Ruegeria sp. 2205SS24-7]
MTTPEWLKPGIYGALFGAAFVGIVGFSWGGWVTGGSAKEMASEMAKDRVIAALVPFCLDMSRTDIERTTKLATIREASSFRRRDAVMEAGWATMPGSEGPNRELAQACIEGLDLDAS